MHQMDLTAQVNLRCEYAYLFTCALSYGYGKSKTGRTPAAPRETVIRYGSSEVIKERVPGLAYFQHGGELVEGWVGSCGIDRRYGNTSMAGFHIH